MVPVVVVTGPVGVGKSTVLAAADRLLANAAVAHATVVLSEVGRCWASAPHTAPTERVIYRNLGALWSNFAAVGAQRLLIELILDDDAAAQLQHLRAAVPEAEVTVVRLQAPITLIEQRIRRRDPYPDDELSAARWLAPRLEHLGIGDLVVENGRRAPGEVAAEILHAVGWLP